MCRWFRLLLFRMGILLNQNTLNVLQLAIGFFLVFFAFQSQGFIEETVLDSYDLKHAGYISLAIIYGVFTFANFIAAPIVGFLKARWATVFGAVCYAIFLAGFLFVNEVYLLLSSALLGLGAAVIWTAQGKYLSLNSTEETASKHSSIFWAISQGCLACGGVFLYIVFHTKGDNDKIEHGTVRILYGVFTAVTIVGTVILALLRMPGRAPLLESNGESQEEEKELGTKETFISTLKLLKTRRMIFAAIAFMYTGIELSFWSGIYPTTVANTKKFTYNTYSLNALTAIVAGLGQTCSGFLFGILSSKTKFLGRPMVVLLGTIIHLLVFVGVYINFPKDAPLGKSYSTGILGEPSIALALVCGFFLSFGDACWNTQCFSFLISRYPTRSAQAFSLFKFFQSLLTCAAFFYGTAIQLQWHILILAIGAIVGCVSFFVADKLVSGDDEDFDDAEHHND